MFPRDSDTDAEDDDDTDTEDDATQGADDSDYSRDEDGEDDSSSSRAGGRKAGINVIKASIDQSGPSNDQEDKYTKPWTRREERLRWLDDQEDKYTELKRTRREEKLGEIAQMFFLHIDRSQIKTQHGIWMKCAQNDPIYHLNNWKSTLNLKIGWKLK